MPSSCPTDGTNGGSGSDRSSSAGFFSFAESQVDDNAVQIIVQDGNLVLRVEHSSQTPVYLRLSVDSLRRESRYFDRLLQPGRFGEGSRVAKELQHLQSRYQTLAEVPSNELPSITVSDLGRISNIKSLSALMTDFFNILHGKDLATLPPVQNLANLAVVADRFDALESVRSYANRKKILRTIDGKTTPKIDGALVEEKVRQRLLVAVMLDYPPWMDKYSGRLITKGWVGGEYDVDKPLWWDLPSGVEQELAVRRAHILDTLESLQTHFLGLYTRRERQCRLGYDSSPQCDSFQLGEMLRFFTRIGTVQLQSTISGATRSQVPYGDDVFALVDSLRQIPEYQIDRNHSHCGIRSRMVPLLDLLQECLHFIGICADCWAEGREQYAWFDTKRPLLWKMQSFCLRTQSHANKHADLRSLFTAVERDWSS